MACGHAGFAAHIRKQTRRLDITAGHALLLPTNDSGMESRQSAHSKGLFPHPAKDFPPIFLGSGFLVSAAIQVVLAKS
jgi:hypothetical protein